MTAQIYSCCDEQRKERLRGQSALNGIDYLEVAGQQRLLRVHFVLPASGLSITRSNIRIDGGARVRGFRIDSIGFNGDVLEILVNTPGDSSPYTLRLVDLDGRSPLPGLDELLAQVTFSFKVECPSPFDCRSDAVCAEPADPPLQLDYLAKDYGSFRRLMLDRLSLLMPEWRERHAADLGIMLVELLAYAADQLSYEQDAVATEAYLGTARRRTSVRRHARLVDYRMHDGCNARVFVQVKVRAGVDSILPKGTQLFTQTNDSPIVVAEKSSELDEALRQAPEIFETMSDTRLVFAHNEMQFYTWSADECCLPCGATSATLADHYPDLAPGALVMFVEQKGPRTGEKADADPTHRHCVRLTYVNAGTPQQPRIDALEGVQITDIAWAEEDALPFPLCISSRMDQAHQVGYSDPIAHGVSVALGNIVVADHGRTIPDEPLGSVPKATLSRPPAPSSHCDPQERVEIPPRFHPRLSRGPLTQSAPMFDEQRPAASVMQWRMEDVLARSASLHSANPTDDWNARDSLLESSEIDPVFVADVEEDGLATIRFGDDAYGRRPAEGQSFEATYRIGNGARGNVAAEAIYHIVATPAYAHVVTAAAIECVRNPLPARGGVDPETIEHVRQAAPAAFRTQERAVTESDYAAVAERIRGVEQAAATFRWTGSWYTVFNTVDRAGGVAVDDAFRRDARAFIDRYRVVGNDLEIDTPRFVPLEIAMRVCVDQQHFRADVHAVLLERFRRFFDPDHFTFAQPLYLSAIYAAARSVEGVDGVVIDVFRRRGFPNSDGLDAGRLDFDRLEIAQLANSRDFPERGVLNVTIQGGR